MYNFVNSSLGWFHLLSALLAMLAGAYILVVRKGTKIHKKVGYAYAVLMLLVNFTAMLIYNLSGYFGVFHVAAIISLLTLIGGMLPMFIKNANMSFKVTHMWFMYYSILGLYAAFFSELSVRLPNKPFYLMVGIATAAVFIFGSIFIMKKEKVWARYFNTKNTNYGKINE